MSISHNLNPFLNYDSLCSSLFFKIRRTSAKSVATSICGFLVNLLTMNVTIRLAKKPGTNALPRQARPQEYRRTGHVP